MRVTIRDVAVKAGVSPMTVSRVINDSPRVNDGTRRRVEAAIAELGYVPNRLARGLIRRKTGALGVIVPDVANPFFTLVVRGGEEVAWRAGYHVILCNTQADLERERGYLEDMLSFQVEGLLIAPVSDRSRPHLRVLTQNGVPFVLIDRAIAGYHGDLVQGDSVVGARQLVDHLITLGHRRIAMITETDEVSTARDRLLGYREAIEAAGIEFSPELVAETSAVDPRGAHEATCRLLDLSEPPTAIFSVNNIAVGGVEAGGTKWVCAVGDGPDGVLETQTFPTTTPAETIARAARFFAQNGGIDALGVGSFGPIDTRRGRITTTPKQGWADTDVVSA